MGVPIARQLKNLLAQAPDSKISPQPNGLIEVVMKGRKHGDELWDSHCRIVFDSRRGHVPMAFGANEQFDPLGSTVKIEYWIRFDDDFSRRYPVAFRYYHEWVGKQPFKKKVEKLFEQPFKKKAPTRTRYTSLVEVEILKFDSITPVDENLFTLKTLGLPAGFPVGKNERTRETYAYKPPPTTTLDELGRQFVAAVAMGNIETLDQLYITSDEFEATFLGDDLDALHASLQEKFRASLKKALPRLQGAQFSRMNMEYCPEPIPARPGMDFGPLVFKTERLITDNTRVIVHVGGEEREIKVDSLVKVGDSWRLLSPDVKLLGSN